MTYIQIIGDYQNEGINSYLEIAEEVVVPLNFGVSDVRDLCSKTGSFSKSIKVAGTKNNNLVLGHLFDVNTVTGVFNINTKQQCLIVQDGDTVLDNAILQLVSIDKISNRMNDDENIVYTVTVKDTVGELFTNIGNTFLSDIDLSNFNHTYNSTNIVASYANTCVDGYKYILPYTNNASYSLIEMKPAVYVWEYFNRIFAMAGYAWEWDEAIDNHFDKLLIPYNGDKQTINEDTLSASEVIAEETTSQDITAYFFTGATPTYDKVFASTEVKDLNGYYNPATSIYSSPYVMVAPNYLNYEIEIDFDLVLDNNEATDVYMAVGGYRFFTPLSIQNISNAQKGASYLQYNTLSAGLAFSGGIEGSILLYNVVTPDYATGETIIASGTNVFTINASNISVGEDLKIGASTIIQQMGSGVFKRRSDNVVANVVPILRVNSISVKIVSGADAYGYNYPVLLSTHIPKQIKQSDFLKSVFTMFNLYCVPDNDDPKKIILKTRNDFYDGGTLKDWSEKLAKDSVNTINFMPELTSKRLTLTYKQDSDEFNKGYTKNVNEIYGQVQYTFDNEYIKNDDTKELIFGSSPFIRTSFGATVTAINGSEPKTLPRVLYDGGEITCGYYQIIDFGTTGTSINTYPLTTHFDKEVNPMFDLNFGICDYYFDKIYNSPTHNNLANLHWRRTMSQINSGKLYVVNLWLTSYDISDLKLNDKIYLDRNYWTINKIIDYNANAKQLTKVELLSIDDYLVLPSFPLKVPVMTNEGSNNMADAVGVLTKDISNSLNNNATKSNVLISGKNITVGQTVRNALIVGDNITVDQDGVYTEDLFVTGKINGKDATEVGQNFANTDLTLTGNRTHGLDGNSFNLIGGNVGIDGNLALVSLPVYANNYDAVTGGLNTGDVYQTTGGGLRIVV
jgi:hypothetical protein